MSMIEVEGKKYKVIESLGFNHTIGMRAWIVAVPDYGEKHVVGTGRAKRFWTPHDRVKPLVEAIDRSNAKRRCARANPIMCQREHPRYEA